MKRLLTYAEVEKLDLWREKKVEAFKWSSAKDHDEAMSIMDQMFVAMYRKMGCYDADKN